MIPAETWPHKSHLQHVAWTHRNLSTHQVIKLELEREPRLQAINANTPARASGPPLF